MAPTCTSTRKLTHLLLLATYATSTTQGAHAAPGLEPAAYYEHDDAPQIAQTDDAITRDAQKNTDNAQDTPIAQQLQTFIDANSTCTDLFPDLKNDTVRQNGGYNKLMLVILDGTFLSFFGADRFYMGMPVAGFFKLITLSGFGMWFVVDYLNVMINALVTDEGMPWSFGPLAYTFADGDVLPKYNYYWTDCTLTYAQMAAFMLMFGDVLLVCFTGMKMMQGMWSIMQKMGTSVKAPSMG